MKIGGACFNDDRMIVKSKITFSNHLVMVQGAGNRLQTGFYDPDRTQLLRPLR